MIDEQNIISVYSREDAIDDGIIVDVTEYIKSITQTRNINKQFDFTYMTSSLVDDLNALNKDDAINTILDILGSIEAGTEDMKDLRHYFLKRDAIIVKASMENSKSVLEVIYSHEN